MRRSLLALCSLLVMLVSGIPAAAQGGRIADIIDSRSDLSTLSVFLDAADPSVRRLLESSGTLTMLAPNNVAFQNLASLLDIPLQELLQEPEIVTELLQYHIINGRYNAARLAQLNGQVVPTQLHGAFIGVRLNEDNVVTINNVVEITQADIAASNGVVHVMNDVLLNRIIATALDNRNIQSVITPNPGVATEAPSPSPTPTTEPTITVSNVRLGHFAPDVPAVDVYINQTLAFENMTFGHISDFFSLTPDTYTIILVPTGASIEEALLEPLDIALTDGAFTTIAAIGSAKNESLELMLLDEDYSEPLEGMSRLTVFHAVEDEPPVDVVMDGEVQAENLAYGESATLDVPHGLNEPLITATGDMESIVLEPPALSLPAGSFAFLAVTGTAEDVHFALQGVRARAAADLRAGNMLATDAGPVMVETVEPGEMNMMEILSEREDFSILAAALRLADTNIMERLADDSGEPITLLAPTNRAFINLLATIGRSQEQLFEDTELISDILLYHMIEGEILAADFRASSGTSIVTMLPENQAFFVTVTANGTVLINGFVQFVDVDIQAQNGVIHSIDDVLLPRVALDTFGM